MTKTIKTELGDIHYVLTRKSVKNINFRFKPDGIVYISASRSIPERFIRQLIEKNAKTIIERLGVLSKRAEHEDGDYFYYLGKKYEICLIPSEENKVLLNERLEVYANDEAEKDRLIEDFYSLKIKELYAKAVNETYEMLKNDGTPAPSAVNIKTMKSRWGSCNIKTRAISLNSRLIKYPIGCLYYVVLHEFAHFHHCDHSKNFYKYIEKYMPDYKKWVRLLKAEYYEVAE